MYTNTDYKIHGAIPLLFSPLANSLLLPFLTPLYLLGNPYSCDRIRPPWSPIARKLNSPFPSPCPYTHNSKILTPRGFSPPNIHSLGWHREPGSQDPVHSWISELRQSARILFLRIDAACWESCIFELMQIAENPVSLNLCKCWDSCISEFLLSAENPESLI